MKKRYLALIAIVLLAGALRFYKLGDVPTGFHRDEAFLGYNAYSILKTGKDMSGNPYPLHLQSFLYSPAGYSYTSIPFIALFGLNEYSVRFASALFGTFSVFILFILVRQLFPKMIPAALFASGLLALSPWHINLSRTATENTVALFFVLLGMYLYLLWVRSNNLKFLIISCISFFLTLFIYQAPRVFVPLLLLLLPAVYWRKLTGHGKTLALTTGVVTMLLVAVIFLSPTRSLRAQTVSIFGNQNTQLVLNEQLTEDSVSGMNGLLPRLFHNKLLGYLSVFAENYFSHWTYQFLFTDKGLPDRYRVPGAGLLYPVELPLLLLGIWFLLRNNKRTGLLMLGWAVIGPIGSALAFDDVPNLQRTLLAYPALAILSSYGAYQLFILLRKHWIIRLLVYSLIGLLFLNVSQYLHVYYIHQLVHRPWYRQEGYKKLVSRVRELAPSYKKMIITNHESSPGIYFLFYNKIDPSYFHSVIYGKNLRDFDRVNFDSYEFPEDPCPLKTTDPKTNRDVPTAEFGVLYVNFSTCEIPVRGANVVNEIHRGDGSVVFRLFEKK